MKHISLIIAICLLSLCTIQAQTFEGKIALTYQSEKGEMDFTYFFRQDVSAADLAFQAQGAPYQMRFIYPQKSPTVLLKSDSPGGKFKYEMPLHAFEGNHFAYAHIPLTATTDSLSIQGYMCKKHIGNDGSFWVEMWVAPQINADFTGFNRFLKEDVAVQLMQFNKLKGFPMQLILQTKGAKPFQSQTVTLISSQTPDDTEFVIGPEYEAQ